MRKGNSMFVLPILITIITFVIVFSINRIQKMGSNAAVSGSTLSLLPATKIGNVGDTFNLTAVVSTDSDSISAAELSITYNPTLIQVVSFTPGTILPVVLTPETHTAGNINVVLGARPANSFKGSGTLGTWTLKILSTQASSIQYTSSTTITAIGKSTNSVVSSLSTSIN